MPMMFFYFLKIIFDISTSKRSKKYKPHSILVKKKKFKFEGNTSTNTVPNVLLVLVHTAEKQSDDDDDLNVTNKARHTHVLPT